jgi:hypothetical protein
MTRFGAERETVAGYTKNISSTGVLFTTGRVPDLGGPIEYLIVLNRECPQPVTLHCMGRVLRADRVGSTPDDSVNFQIAATLERYEFVRGQGASV